MTSLKFSISIVLAMALISTTLVGQKQAGDPELTRKIARFAPTTLTADTSALGGRPDIPQRHRQRRVVMRIGHAQRSIWRTLRFAMVRAKLKNCRSTGDKSAFHEAKPGSASGRRCVSAEKPPHPYAHSDAEQSRDQSRGNSLRRPKRGTKPAARQAATV